MARAAHTFLVPIRNFVSYFPFMHVDGKIIIQITKHLVKTQHFLTCFQKRYCTLFRVEFLMNFMFIVIIFSVSLFQH
jgi:hypothetical protein